MKRAYVKPQILFENFALSTNIASGCTAISDMHSSGTCGYDFSGLMVFLYGVSGCGDVEIDANIGEFNGICYHVPIETSSLFNS